MNLDRSSLISYGSTTLFVLLWSSGAIFSELGLEHASAFAFLLLRFAIAFSVLFVIGLYRRRWLPAPGTRIRVAFAGSLFIGSYSICYFQSLDHGVTPGVLATVLGVQPILTLALTERRFSIARLAGLCLAMLGLVLVVYQSIGMARFSITGMLFALAALGSISIGAILQKKVNQAPMEVLPIQYGVTIVLCLAFTPFEPIKFEFNLAFIIPLLWLGIVISVGTTLLFYHLIRAGNLVNVTSLLYLVPAVTAAMDWFFLGNRLSSLSLLGMATILFGLALVFRTGRAGD